MKKFKILIVFLCFASYLGAQNYIMYTKDSVDGAGRDLYVTLPYFNTHSSSGLTIDTARTVSFTAISGYHHLLDCSSRNITTTLPPALANGKPIQFTVVNGTYGLTINCAGTDHFNYASGATSKSKVLKDSWIRLTPKVGVWIIEEGNSLTQLDGRYKSSIYQTFTGVANLSKTEGYYYNNYTLAGALAISVTTDSIGGQAFGVIIGNGTNTPTLSGITLWPGSDSFDPTNLAQNAFQIRKWSNGIVYIAWKKLN